MKKRIFFMGIVLPVLVYLSGCCCCGGPGPEEKHHDEATVMSLLYQQRAAEYRALCLQAFNLARARVDEALKSAHARKLAIITDLDETALDNSVSGAWVYFHDTTNSFPLLLQWWLKGIADSVPGSVSFFTYAFSKGVDVYYVSNRPDSPAIVKATMKNMKSLGFPLTGDNDSSHFLFLKPHTKFNSKEARRKYVEGIDSVIVYLGDNLADLDASFDGVSREDRRVQVDRLAGMFGGRYIVFPNAVYGDWENAMYRGFRGVGSPSLRQRDSMRRELLDTMGKDF